MNPIPKFQMAVRVDNTGLDSPPPFMALGVQCDTESISDIHFLPEMPQMIGPQNQWQRDLVNQLRAYFTPSNTACFDAFKSRLNPSSVLRPDMLKVVCRIPFGRVCSYGNIAKKIGWDNKRGGQNVGNACGLNRVGMIVPCYRAVSRGRRKGSLRLGGYLGSNPFVDNPLEIKAWFLEHEQGIEVDRVPGKPISEWTEINYKSA